MAIAAALKGAKELAAAGAMARKERAATAVGEYAAGRRNRPKVRVKSQGVDNQAVVTALTVILGVSGLKSAIVDKSLPPTSYWIRLTFLGLGLALFNQASPKLGKPFAYLVMVAVVVNQAEAIITELELLETDESSRRKKDEKLRAAGDIPTTLASLRTTDREGTTLYFERGNNQQPTRALRPQSRFRRDPQTGKAKPQTVYI